MYKKDFNLYAIKLHKPRGFYSICPYYTDSETRLHRDLLLSNATFPFGVTKVFYK